MNTELYDQMVNAQASFHDRAMAIPGVHGTSIGKKYVGGQATETFVIVIHVSKKKALEDVPVSERIPEQIEGFPTDVIEHGSAYPIVSDLIGGADLRVNSHAGTLGCIVRDKTDSTTCLLSNQHVLLDVGTTVYVQKNDVCHKIGTTKRTALNSTVDAGIASINSGIGSSPSIAEIGNVAGSRALTWQDIGTEVRKYGRTTALTYGTITGLNYRGKDSLGNPSQSQVIMEPVTAKNKEFVAPGDSGSAIVDGKNFIVALLWGKSIGAETAWANRIENVLTVLNIEVLTPTTADAPQPYSETFAGQLEALCTNSARGQGYLRMYLEHRDEVQHLFHENARLYATWRKIPQEAFMDALRAGVRHPDGIIPAALDGEDTLDVLTQLRDATGKYVEDAEFTRQMDSLFTDLSSHIGGTWQQAIADRDAAAEAPYKPLAGDGS